MKVREVVKFYGNYDKAAAAVGCSPQAISVWLKKKKISIEYQIKWEVASKGALKADIPQQLRNAA